MYLHMKPSDEEIGRMQRKYHYLVNYQSGDPADVIDPLTYTDSNGDTLLHIAAHLGDIDTVETLLKAGMDVNMIGDMGSTALHYAKAQKHDAVAAVLVANGANPNMRNEFGQLAGQDKR
jgi:ankyrin repeat protein